MLSSLEDFRSRFISMIFRFAADCYVMLNGVKFAVALAAFTGIFYKISFLP